MTIYAPSLVLSVMLGMDIRITSIIIGGLVIIYTTSGGVKAVNYTDFFSTHRCHGGNVYRARRRSFPAPKEISFTDALSVSAVMGKLNTVDFTLDFSNRYNVWSGIIGGMFVALAYFGTDQSQVQRYLTSKSVTQSRLALLFNGLAKVPMQFFILFIGVMVFVFFQFVQPPLVFNPVETAKVKSGEKAQDFFHLEEKQKTLFREKSEQLREYLQARHQHDAVRAAPK